jgi:hypothetical protein
MTARLSISARRNERRRVRRRQSKEDELIRRRTNRGVSPELFRQFNLNHVRLDIRGA